MKNTSVDTDMMRVENTATPSITPTNAARMSSESTTTTIMMMPIMNANKSGKRRYESEDEQQCSSSGSIDDIKDFNDFAFVPPEIISGSSSLSSAKLALISENSTVADASPAHEAANKNMAILLLPLLCLGTIAWTLRKIFRHLYRDPFHGAYYMNTDDNYNHDTADSTNVKTNQLPRCRVPAHPLLGHMPQAFSPPDTLAYRSVFLDNANASGLSTFWFLSTPSLSVLKAEHARSILRHSVERKSFNIFKRHFKKTLGKHSLVIMEGGGMKWRHHRNLIKVAFTEKAVRGMSGKVWRVANGFCRSILERCRRQSQEYQDQDKDRPQEHEGSGTYKAEGLDLFKWATLDVFGQVALGYDFGCTTSLRQTPLAASFDLAVEDSNNRCTPLNLFNPLTQFYWIPTERNKEYKRNSDNVRGLLLDICEKKVVEIEERTAANTTSSSAKNDKNGLKGMRSISRSNSVNENDDLLTILLKSNISQELSSSSSQSQNKEESYSDMVEMLMTLFFAGYDTSSIGLSMVMWEVAQNPKIQLECAKEAHKASYPDLYNEATATAASLAPSASEAALAMKNTCSSTQDEHQAVEQEKEEEEESLFFDPSQWETRLAYNWAVIMETLRLHPPVFNNVRNLTKSVQLDNYTVPSGTRVYIPIMLIHTDERNFARPLEFLPERWVKFDKTLQRWVPRDYTDEPSVMPGNPNYIPPANPNYLFTFSDGARNCVGKRLALQESTMLLSCIVRDLNVRTREGYVLQKRKKFAMAPPTEMPIIFTQREW